MVTSRVVGGQAARGGRRKESSAVERAISEVLLRMALSRDNQQRIEAAGDGTAVAATEDSSAREGLGHGP